MAKAAIVGAGVFGVTTAIELARRGWDVALLDPGPLPHPLAASTDISKVIRMDYGADELTMELMERALGGWEAWNAAWDEPLYHPDGFLVLTRDPMQPGGFEHDSFALLERRGHRPERVDRGELARRFPRWNPALYADGYVNPRGGWAESGKVMARLLERARAAGVELREGFVTSALLEHVSRIVGVRSTSGDECRADVVVVAAGAWTPTLLPHLTDVMWAVGQPVMFFRPEDPSAFRAPSFPTWAADIARTGWYGFPANADGIVKVANHGAGRPIHPDAPRSLAAEEEDRFRAFLRGTFPSLADAALAGSRLCLYCDTWDGSFLIDRDPERQGLVVAAGDSGHAFKFAPVLGPIIADAVEGAPNPDARRFAWRPRGAIAHEDARHGAGS